MNELNQLTLTIQNTINTLKIGINNVAQQITALLPDCKDRHAMHVNLELVSMILNNFIPKEEAQPTLAPVTQAAPVAAKPKSKAK